MLHDYTYKRHVSPTRCYFVVITKNDQPGLILLRQFQLPETEKRSVCVQAYWSPFEYEVLDVEVNNNAKSASEYYERNHLAKQWGYQIQCCFSTETYMDFRNDGELQRQGTRVD